MSLKNIMVASHLVMYYNSVNKKKKEKIHKKMLAKGCLQLVKVIISNFLQNNMNINHGN